MFARGSAAGVLISVLVLLMTACTEPPNRVPCAVFSWEPLNEGSVVEVAFDASSSYDPDGQIISYKWDFDDRNTAAYGVTTTHMYHPGTYHPSLTVRDNDGAADTATKTVQIEDFVYIPPTPSVRPEDFVVSGVWFTPAGHVFLFGECVDIYGTVSNTSPVTCGVELEASAYDATGLLVGRVTFWPASTNNIPAGASHPIDYFIYDLTVPSEYVVSVYIRPIRVKQWQP